MTSRTFSVVLTPPGRGAVASVLVDGPRATEIAGRFFQSASGKPLAEYALGRVAFGRWNDGPGEELVACRRTEQRVEIHCHGGQAAVGALLGSLATAGCQVLPWSEWSASQPGGRIQRQAAEALAQASTERTASILLDQFSGALGSAIHEILRLLESGDANSLASARTSLDSLRSRCRLGRRLTEPFRVVLAGRPNVGKSSLVNALLGYRRSIVFDQPGTTRDVVTAVTAFEGWPVEISDTAGLRATENPLEDAGVRRAEQTLRDAELRVLVFDSSAAWSKDDRTLLEAWPDALAVHNKIDLPPSAGPARPAAIEVSAITMAGIDKLAEALIVRLAPDAPPPGGWGLFPLSLPGAFGGWEMPLARRLARGVGRLALADVKRQPQLPGFPSFRILCDSRIVECPPSSCEPYRRQRGARYTWPAKTDSATFKEERAMQLIARGLISLCAMCCAAPVEGEEASSEGAFITDIPAELAAESSAAAPVVPERGVEAFAPPHDGPSPSSEGPRHGEIAPVEFDGIQPGVATLEDVRQIWGEPMGGQQQLELTIGLYSREPFEQVEVAFFKDKVQSITVRLRQSFTAREVAEQLELSNLEPAFVRDEAGVRTSAIYPERSVILHSPAIEQSAKDSGRFQVSEIVFGEIQPRLFLLRAQARAASEDSGALADLEQVLTREPNSLPARQLMAQVLSRNGRRDDALAAIEIALQSEPENPEFRLLHAELSAACGQYDEAVAETKQVLALREMPALVRARGLVQLGELIAAGRMPDYRQSVELHLQAIELAEPYVEDRLPAVRGVAFDTLIDAHLATANSIAWGRWKKKEMAVPKWIERAEAIAGGAIEGGELGADCSLRVCQSALAACVGAQGTMDPAAWTERAAEIGRERLAQAHDPLYRSRLQWQLGLIFHDALQACQLRQEFDAALKHGQSAIACLENGAAGRQQSPEDAYMLGRLYYRMATLNAMHLGRHQQAVALYEKALPLLDRQSGGAEVASRRGEELVTAAISYWNLRRRDQAMSLTSRGIGLLEQAVEQGVIDKAALAVPYANLAAMHEQLGDRVQAASYSEQATNVGADPVGR